MNTTNSKDELTAAIEQVGLLYVNRAQPLSLSQPPSEVGVQGCNGWPSVPGEGVFVIVHDAVIVVRSTEAVHFLD